MRIRNTVTNTGRCAFLLFVPAVQILKYYARNSLITRQCEHNRVKRGEKRCFWGTVGTGTCWNTAFFARRFTEKYKSRKHIFLQFTFRRLMAGSRFSSASLGTGVRSAALILWKSPHEITNFKLTIPHTVQTFPVMQNKSKNLASLSPLYPITHLKARVDDLSLAPVASVRSRCLAGMEMAGACR